MPTDTFSPLDPVPLFVGLDAGGSKTSLLAATPADDDLSLTGPAANLQRAGLETTAGVLADLVSAAAAARPDSRPAAICAGVAGAGRDNDGPRLAAALRERLGPAAPPHIQIVHDGEIALEGAFEGGSGAIVIAGTGSIALARADDGTFLRVGGWGYLLGDDGSGHALGIGGLRAAAAALDGGPATRLTDLLAHGHGLANRDDLIDAVYSGRLPVQRVAPLVLQAATDGDGPAQHVLREQTQALVKHVAWLAKRCDRVERRLALIGGLSNEKAYRTAFFEALHDALPTWRLQKPLHAPVVGALRLARQAAEAA